MALNSINPVKIISAQEYLEGERESELKHEYINGGVYAMPGASANHNRLVSGMLAALYAHLVKTSCEVFIADMKVKAGQHFFYPDVIVDAQNINGDACYTEFPLIIIEVLSKATRKIDHTIKRQAYQNLSSLQEYVLIEQDFVDIRICRRSKHWQSEHYFLGDQLYLESVDFSLPVETIYARVDNEDMRAFFADQKTADV